MQSLSLEPAILQQYWQDVSPELGELFSLLETHEKIRSVGLFLLPE